MKKMEALLNKLSKMKKEIIKENNLDGINFIFVVFMVLYVGIAIWFAVVARNYTFLSLMAFIWSWMISEYIIIRKVFLKRVDKYLLQTHKTSKLILSILGTASMILAWKYWMVCIFTAILGFIFADYRKNTKVGVH